MPIFQPEIYKRADAKRNRDALFVFGDNTLRKGLGGQAGEMRGEPNAVGVRTKYFPGFAQDDYFGDEPAQILAQNRMIDEDMKILFQHVRFGRIVVWPASNIGTGLSRMPECAPTSFEYLMSKFAALCETAVLFDEHNAAKLSEMRTLHE